MIVINDLVKKYPSRNKTEEDVRALDGLSLFLPDKGFIAIYGASGCGKSTLLNVLGGLDVADSGQMIVNGRDTTGFNEHDWNAYRNQEVGFIFQNYYLLPHLNVYDNIAITLQMSKQTKDIKKKIHEALKAVDLTGFDKRFPRQLSGGQQQRVAIARALISNPSIILADEPTGALDEKSSKIVLKTLKRISQEHLVVMVTHNERMAKEYADRMIEISYGKIIEDTQIQKETDDIICKSPLLKVHLPFKTSVNWSARNVVKKRGRSIPIAIATAIGLASAGLVLNMTNSVSDYVNNAQGEAIANYPVQVRAYHKQSSESAKDYLIEYPDSMDVIVEKSDASLRVHQLTMEKDFITYLDNMPQEYYTGVHTNRVLNFNMLTYIDEVGYRKVNTVATSCIAPSANIYDFILDQYDILGDDPNAHLPTNANELALVVDSYNRVDTTILQGLGFDTSGDTIKYKDIFGKKYRLISNNEMYHVSGTYTDEDGNTYNEYDEYKAGRYEELYNNNAMADLEPKITAVLRPKKNNPDPVFNTILLYHPDLLNKLIDDNENSNIVKDQNEYGINFDVIKHAPFSSIVSNLKTPELLLEERITNIGGRPIVTEYYYYTKTSYQREQITDYVMDFPVKKDSETTIKVKDYLEQVAQSFNAVIKTTNTVLLAFSGASILVAVILTAILTYISVVERKREIGLLRSLGARKIDVSCMFIFESLIIGLVAGLVSVGLCYGLAPVVSRIVVSIIQEGGNNIFEPSVDQFASVQPWLIPAMLGASIVIGIISALIPAIIAGKKKPADTLKE